LRAVAGRGTTGSNVAAGMLPAGASRANEQLGKNTWMIKGCSPRHATECLGLRGRKIPEARGCERRMSQGTLRSALGYLNDTHGLTTMPIRRYYIPNSQIFITVVTQNRSPVFTNKVNIELYWKVAQSVQTLHPFHLFAYCVMPDHFHWILQMPEEQPDFSKVIQSFKWNYLREYKKLHGIQGSLSLWQKRFWDHVIRDEKDLQTHVDYVHYNPVKHGFVQDPIEWENSTFRFWQEKGMYDPDWGCVIEPASIKSVDLD
jgi:putative transposase